MSEKIVKVHILKSVGTYVQGDQVEVPESMAKVLCEVRKRNNGYGLVEFQNAITVSELEARKAAPIDIGGLTLDEAREMGLRNTVATPQSEIDKPFHPGFMDSKDPMESASGKEAEKINAANPNKKKAS